MNPSSDDTSSIFDEGNGIVMRHPPDETEMLSCLLLVYKQFVELYRKISGGRKKRWFGTRIKIIV